MSDIKCPYCEKEFRTDSDDIVNAMESSDESITTICPRCNLEFLMYYEISIRFYGERKALCLNDEEGEHVWGSWYNGGVMHTSMDTHIPMMVRRCGACGKREKKMEEKDND